MIRSPSATANRRDVSVHDDWNPRIHSRGNAAETRMTPDELSSLLRASRTDAPERDPACPDEHSIAAYVDGTLESATRERLELHLADCSHCLALVGLLSRAQEAPAAEAPPEPVITRARSLARTRSRRWGFPAPQWAAAAAVVLAVGTLVLVSQTPGPTRAIWQSDAPTVRTGTSPSLQLLSPDDGATIDRTQLTVRWSTVLGARYYDVRVVTEAGDVVIEDQVTGTEWSPKNHASLRPGLEYFVRVDAYVSEGKSIGSEHTSFQVSD